MTAIATIIVTATMARRGADWTEYLGYLTGAASVWLFMSNHVAAWPIGIANSMFLFVVFWRARLFADTWLQAVYVVLGVAGWWMWVRYGPERVQRPTTVASPRMRMAVGVTVLLGWFALWWWFGVNTSAVAPMWDGLLTAASLGAQFLLMRRVVDTWPLWMAVDVGYIALFWSRDLHITAVLYAVFFAMCANGFVEWKSDLRRDTAPSLAPA